MKKKRDFLSHLLIFVLIIVPLILVVIWFKDGKMIAGAEEGLLLYNPERSFNLLKYTWLELGTGNINTVFLPSLTFLYFVTKLHSFGLPIFLIQAITFYCLMTTSLISTYFLSVVFLGEFKITTFSNSAKRTLAFFASLYYLLNPYSIFSVWQRFLHPLMFLQALLPLGLLLFVLGLKKRRFYFTFLLCLSSFFLSEAFAIPVFFITFSSALIVYSISIILAHRKNSKVIKFTTYYLLLTLFFLIFTNCWWLLFLFNTGPSAFGSYSSTQINLGILKGVANNLGITNVIRLIDLTPGFNQKLWGEIYSTLPFQIISIIAPIIVLTTLVKLRKFKPVRILSIIFLFSFFVANGASFPFGKIFIFFFKRIQFLQSFRNPFEKYGIVLSLTFSLLFGIGISYCYTLFKNKWGKSRSTLIMVISLFSLLMIYPFPMWKGNVFGGIKNNYRVVVPKYYDKVYETIDTGEERIIELPFNTSGGFHTLWPNKYQGSIISRDVFPRETLSGKTKTPYMDQLLPNMWDVFYQGDFWKAMHLTGSKYLILHHDIDYQRGNADSPENIKSHLEYSYTPGKKIVSNPCSTWESFNKEDGKITLRCKIAPEYSDWSNSTFVDIELLSNGPAKVWFHAEASDRKSAWWNELLETNYEIDNKQNTNIFTLSLPATKARFPKFKFDDLNYFYVHINPQPINTNETQKQDTTKVKDIREDGVDFEVKQIYLTTSSKESVQNIHFVDRMGDLSIYEIGENLVLPRIFTTSELREVKNVKKIFESLEDDFSPLTSRSFLTMDQKLNYELTDIPLTSPEISYNKIDQTHYEISVENAEGPFVLVFNSTFHSLWHLSANSNKVDKHFRVNQYANGYLIEETGSFKMNLEFKGQDVFEKGITTSIVSFSLLLFFVLMGDRKKNQVLLQRDQ